MAAEADERKRRGQAPEHLETHFLASPSKFKLGIKGSKVALQQPHSKVRGSYTSASAKSSQIPKPDSPAPRPLPPPGCVVRSTPPTPLISSDPSRVSPTPLYSDSAPLTHNPWQMTRDIPRIRVTQILRPRQTADTGIRVVVKTESEMIARKRAVSKQTPTRGGQDSKGSKGAVKYPARVGSRVGKRMMPGSDVQYNWNKEGRLEELKIRYLARKYLAVWMRRVFGRVLPSVARLHHETTVKRCVFSMWQEQWWVARKEWKLSIRADCHNRYRLWQSVWKAWTEYVQMAKERRRKTESAQKFASLKLKQLAWRAWCEYVLVRREKRGVQREVDQWTTTRALRSAWMRWIGALQAKRQLEMMGTISLHHWAYKLQKSAWLCWLARYQEQQVMREKAATAGAHHRHRVLRECWAAWQAYTDLRQRKTQLRGVAVEHHSRGVMVKYFYSWRLRYLRVRQIAEFEELLAEKGRLARLRRALTCWKYYLELQHYRAYQMEIASVQYAATLKAKVLHSLRDYAEQQQKHAADKALAQQFHIRKTVQWSWLQWLLRCEHCEEIKMLPQTRRARSHHISLLLGKAIAIWKSYILWRRHRKQEYAVADEHFKSVALPKCFAAMQEFVVIQQYKQAIHEKAISFRRETLLAMVFYKWWRSYHLSQDVRMLARVAILHSEEVVKRQALKIWRARTADRIRQFSQEHAAVLHYRHRVLSTAFEKWKSRRDSTLLSVHQFRQASQHHSHNLLKRAWSAWMRYVAKRRLSHQRDALAGTLYHRTVLQKVLQAWKVYHCRASVKNAKRNRARQFHHMLLKRHALAQWYANVQFLKLQSSMEHHAAAHFRTTVARKCFSLWWDRTAVSIEESRREDEAVQGAVQQLSTAKVARVFMAWREHTCCVLVERLKVERAGRHSGRAVLRRCFTAWHDHYRVGLKKVLLQRQCTWFQNTRLLSTFYSKWRLEFMKAIVMGQKCTVALWHWSHTLQRKVLAAWLLYTMNRRRKAERYALAMDRYRERLLTLGVTQWIKVASAIRTQRTESALQQQAQSARSVWRCVQRCALHWRKVARNRRREKGAKVAMVVDRQSRPPGMRVAVGQETFAHKEEGDLWNSLARRLQIPDRMPHIRPQPRKPDFLRALATRPPSAPPSKSPALEVAAHVDAVPRESVPCPPSPPVLYSSRRDVSFTFLPSTCSEESATVQKSNPLTQHSDHSPQQPPQPSSTHQSSLVPPVVQRPVDARTSGTSTHQSSHGHPVIQRPVDARTSGTSTYQSSLGPPVVQRPVDARTSGTPTHQSSLVPPVVQRPGDARTSGTSTHQSSLVPPVVQRPGDARTSGTSTHQSSLVPPVVQRPGDARTSGTSTHQSSLGPPVVQRPGDARTSGTSTHQSSLGPPVIQQPGDPRTSGTSTLALRHTHTPLQTRDSHPHSLLPPSAFEKPRAGSSSDVAAHKLPVTSGHRTTEPDPDIPLGLTNPTIQTEIVHMRNELKQYHDLKVRQRCLEQQVSQAMEEGGTREHMTELQRELASTVEVIQANGPRISNMASRISQLLSQS